MEFFDVLVGYEIALWSAVDHELARQGEINLGQLHALRLVEQHRGSARVQDLSDAIGITVGATSKLVDRLEGEGLVARSPHPSDRRSSLIGLTPDGERSLASGSSVFRSAVAAAVGTEPVDEVTVVLRRLHARLAGSGEGAAE